MLDQKFTCQTFFDLLNLAEDLGKNGQDITSLGLGVPFYPMLPLLKKYSCTIAGQDNLDFYPPFAGDTELREEIAHYENYQHHQNLTKENILVTCGATEAVFLALKVILESAKGEIIIPAPYFYSYHDQVINAGGKVVPVAMKKKRNGKFDLDIEAIKAKINSKTRAVLINSPQNPTGAVFSEASLRKLWRLAQKNDFFVITDDVYDQLYFDKKPFSLADIVGSEEKLLRCQSFSKTFGMTGWRVGYLQAPKKLIPVAMGVHVGLAAQITVLSQKIVLFALKHRAEIEKSIVKNREILAQNRDLVLSSNQGLGDFWELNYPEGAFYAFAKIKNSQYTDLQVAEILLREAGVLTLPGCAYGEYGLGYLRLSFGTKAKELKKAFAKIKKWYLNCQ